MGVLSDWQLRQLNAIHPFEEGIKRENVISYGVTSYGYDVRAGYVFDVFDQTFEPDQPVDPKAFNKNMLRRVDLRPNECVWYEQKKDKGMRTQESTFICEYCKDVIEQVKPLDDTINHRICRDRQQPRNYVVIPPNSFALTETIEAFDIPRDCLVLALGKSTYARCGLVLNVTPGEPQWEGRWTIELSNTSPRAIKVYAGEGIGQMIFLRSDGVTQSLLWSYLQLLSLTAPNPETMLKELEDQLGRSVMEILRPQVQPRGTCEKSYADKKGKYQSQTGLTYPTVDGKQT